MVMVTTSAKYAEGPANLAQEAVAHVVLAKEKISDPSEPRRSRIVLSCSTHTLIFWGDEGAHSPVYEMPWCFSSSNLRLDHFRTAS